MLTPKRIKTFQGHFTLLMSLTSFASAVLIPVYKHFSTPKPFTAAYHVQEVSLPSMVASPSVPSAPTPRRRKEDTAETAPSRFWTNSKALLRLSISNNGAAARHAVSIRISFVHQFGAVGVRSMPFLMEIDKWRDPVFRESDQVLEFSSVSELPVASSVQLSIWGQFDEVFRCIEVRSAEGTADIEEQELLSGWPVTLAANLWWAATLICLGLGLLLLRSYEHRRGP